MITNNKNLEISIDCYRDQFIKQLKILEPRLLKYVNPSKIIMYYYSGINESVAVDKFIDSHASIIGEM